MLRFPFFHVDAAQLSCISEIFYLFKYIFYLFKDTHTLREGAKTIGMSENK